MPAVRPRARRTTIREVLEAAIELEKRTMALYVGFVKAFPRPAEEVVGEVLAARAEGLAGEGDDLSPAADPELPAVTLRSDAPPAEPLVLRLPAAALPAPVLRLVESGEYLVHAVRLPAPFALRLAARLESDEDLRVALAPADYTRWRDVLARALAAAGVPVD